MLSENEQLVFSSLYHAKVCPAMSETMTIDMLVAETGLSVPQVLQSLDSLQDRGFAHKVDEHLWMFSRVSKPQETVN